MKTEGVLVANYGGLDELSEYTLIVNFDKVNEYEQVVCRVLRYQLFVQVFFIGEIK